jgi:hypothetical protein
MATPSQNTGSGLPVVTTGMYLFKLPPSILPRVDSYLLYSADATRKRPGSSLDTVPADKRTRLNDSGFHEVDGANQDDSTLGDEDEEDEDDGVRRLVFKLPIIIEKPHRVIKKVNRKSTEKTEYHRPPLLMLNIQERTRFNQELREPIAKQADFKREHVDWNKVQWRYETDPVKNFREMGGCG